jgi:hypothetical protein
LVVLTVTVLLALDVDAVVGRQSLLESHSHTEAQHGRETTVCHGRRDLNGDLYDCVW